MPNLKTFTDRALEEFDEKYGPIWHLWNQVVQVSAKLERTPNASPELAIKAFLTAKLQELAEEVAGVASVEESKDWEAEHPKDWVDCCGDGEVSGWNAAREQSKSQLQEYLTEGNGGSTKV